MIGAYKKIKEDVDYIIQYSQDYPFSVDSTELIERWAKAKQPFIDLFGGKLIIRSKDKIHAHIPNSMQKEKFDEFIKTLKDDELINDDLENFLELNSLGLFTNTVTFPDYVRNIPIGMKLSKSIKKFLPQDKARKVQDIASQYMYLNKLEGYLYLSIDPRDFLTLSENNYGWVNCHSLDGDYRAGNLSYMVDSTTVIAYLADEKQEKLNATNQLEWNSKKWRILLHTDMKNCIYFNRQYPVESKALLDEVYTWIEKLLGISFTKPTTDVINAFMSQGMEESFFYNKLYPFGSRIYDTRDIVDIKDFRGYCDIILSGSYEAKVSINCAKMEKARCQVFDIMTREEEDKWVYELWSIKIGGKAPCVKCGKEDIERENSLLCETCIACNDADEDFFDICDSCYHRLYPLQKVYQGKNGDCLCKRCFNKNIKNKGDKKEWLRKAILHEKQ